MIQLHPACFAICDKAEMMNYLVTLCFFAWEYRSSSNNMNLLWPWCVVISQQDHYTDSTILFICEVLQSSNMLVWVSFNHFKTLRIGTLNSRCKRCTDLYLCSSFPSLHVIPEQSWWFRSLLRRWTKGKLGQRWNDKAYHSFVAYKLD